MSLRLITDPAKIQRWIQERNGVPARVRGDKSGLRVKFSDANGDLESVSWEDFVQAFDDEHFVMLVDDEPGKTFYKIHQHK